MSAISSIRSYHQTSVSRDGGLWFGTAVLAASVVLLCGAATTHGQGAGWALEFDGVQDYVSIPHHPSLYLDWEYSIGLFFQPAQLFDATATDYHGLLDKGEYQMFLDPTDGRLRFVQPMAGSFSGEFNPNFDSSVYAIASYDDWVYVAGTFHHAGSVECSLIARWSGEAWSPVGTGLIGEEARALAVYDGELYVGGQFDSAGGVQVNNIARWDGSTWNSVGEGTDGMIHALYRYQFEDTLYVGGPFTTAGGQSAGGLARWDGSNWSVPGSWACDTPHTVFAFAEHNTDLYVGGWFTTAAGAPADYIAKWDGSNWSSVGSELDAGVHALAVYDSQLFAGGHFTTPSHLATWNGNAWVAVGAGGEWDWDVNALATFSGQLYAAGLFTVADGLPASRIARWDGNAWAPAGEGVSHGEYPSVRALCACGGLWVGGDFTRVADEPARHVAVWDGAAWDRLDQGIENTVHALTVFDGAVYAGGMFNAAGEVPASAVAKWDGTTWSALGTGLDKEIGLPRAFALAEYANELYVGGYFESAGGVAAKNIARWNGASWMALGTGVGDSLLDEVETLGVYEDDLYVGGSFDTAGSTSALNLARWNGSSWNDVDGGLDGTGTIFVNALVEYAGDLYVGGRFETAGGVPASNIARWNGSTWSAVGPGTSEDVLSLAVFNNDLYVGGRFWDAGGLEVVHIARWDGSAWHPVGTGTDWSGDVHALTVYQNELYAGGEFIIAGGVLAPFVARWNGSAWNALYVGTDEPVYALAAWDHPQYGGLFIGGDFARAGDWVSDHVARWTRSERTIASVRTAWPPVQHHVAVTYSPYDETLELYVNGVREAIEVAPSDSDPDTTVTPLWIGRSSGSPVEGGTGEFFAGQIDEIRIVESYADQEEVRDTLNLSMPDEEQWFAAYYRLDEGGGGVIEDSSVNYNSGTLIGSPAWVVSDAPIGNAAMWTDSSTDLWLFSASSDGLEISDITDAPPFACLIGIAEPPNSTAAGPGLFQVFEPHYFEVWIPDADATYAATYYYTDHPDIADVDVPALAARPRATTPVWQDTGAALNPENGTLVAAGQSDTQYILAEQGFELTMAVSPPDVGMTIPPENTTTTHPALTEVELQATPDAGYTFLRWEASPPDPAPVEDPDCSSEATVTLDQDRTVTAVIAPGPTETFWMGGTACPGFPSSECWNTAENWCPQVVPDNVTAGGFEVTVAQGAATVNISPTIDSLTVGNGATIRVDQASGADVRTLVVLQSIVNEGTLHATDAKRIVLDAPAIDQSQPSAGLLKAESGGVIQINGSQVTGGVAHTLDCESSIELLGGAEFNSVTIQSDCGRAQGDAVVIPDAQSGVLTGEIVNIGGVGVLAAQDVTTLLPGENGVSLAGSGSIALQHEDLAWLGAFGVDRSITNGPQHRIEGAGVIFGVLENNGIIEANQSGASLTISEPGAKVNNGLLQAVDGGVLNIWTDVSGDGDLMVMNTATVNCLLGLVSVGAVVIGGGQANVEDSEVEIGEGLDVVPGSQSTVHIDNSLVTSASHANITGGSVTVANASLLQVNGPLSLCPGPADVAELHVLNSTVAATDFGLCAGSVLEVASAVSLAGSFSFTNTDEASWSWGASAILELMGGLGLPPDNPIGYARLEVGGMDLGLAPELHQGDPAGFDGNFDLSEMIIGSGAHVSLVDAIDNGNRVDVGFGADEALYVDTLTFSDAAGRLDLNGLHLYYATLNGDPTQLVDLSAFWCDHDSDGDVDLGDFAAFQVCCGEGSASSGCEMFDLDQDGETNLDDFAEFSRRLTAVQTP